MLKKFSFRLMVIALIALLGACANKPLLKYRALDFGTRIYVGEVPLEVVVFDTPEERKLGLMHVKELPLGKGALFVFEQEREVSFWMKNTQFPMAMLFFNGQGNMVHKIDSIPPCQNSVCPKVNVGMVQYVIEIPAYYLKSLGLKFSDRLKK